MYNINSLQKSAVGNYPNTYKHKQFQDHSKSTYCVKVVVPQFCLIIIEI